MRKIIALVLTFFVLIFNFGCSAFAPKTQTLSVNCQDEGTKLQVNGNMYNCPTQIDVPRNKSVNLMAFKDGHHNHMRTIDSKINGLFVLDVVGGLIWLVPFVGLVSPGAYSLETQEVNISMVSKDSPRPVPTASVVQSPEI